MGGEGGVLAFIINTGYENSQFEVEYRSSIDYQGAVSKNHTSIYAHTALYFLTTHQKMMISDIMFM